MGKSRRQLVQERAADRCEYCLMPQSLTILPHETDLLSALFNPRIDRWSDHFEWHGAELRGRTAIGRATIDVLQINDPARVALRAFQMAAGTYRRE